MKKLGFGAMRLPMMNGDSGMIDIEHLTEMVDLFLERGFTYFDTSYVYHGGESEKILKQVLVDRYPRSSFTITTKAPVFLIESQQHFFHIFDEQLDRLGTDYVDYYWLHAVNGEMYKRIESLKLVDALAQLKQEGRAKHIGFSYHDSPELLDRILTEHPELEYVQLQLNYFDWDSPYVAAKDCYEVCKKHGKLVVVMEPVKGGALASLPGELEDILKTCDPNLSTASWAIRFAASLDHVFMVLSGMSNMEQMQDNISYMEQFHPFSEQESVAVSKVAQALRQDMDLYAGGFCGGGSPLSEENRACENRANAERSQKDGRLYQHQYLLRSLSRFCRESRRLQPVRKMPAFGKWERRDCHAEKGQRYDYTFLRKGETPQGDTIMA